MKYDVIYVGAGVANVISAYNLIKNKPETKILMIEKGRNIKKRICPKRTTGVCVNCKPECSILAGFGGNGSFSDGKASLTKDGSVGGDLFDIVGFEEGQELIKEVDDIYLSLGATNELYGATTTPEIQEIRRKAIGANLKLIECPVRHYGSDGGYIIFSRLQEILLDSGVDIHFETMVENLIYEDDSYEKVIGVIENNNGEFKEFYGDAIIVGVGRSGCSWFDRICKENEKIKTEVGTVDIGVRVEVRNEIMKELNEAMYEAKLVLHTPTFDDKIRTFCTNPSGEVTIENYNKGDKHLVTVNGHAYAEKEKSTENTNFALLVSKNFTEPFKSPIEYGESIAQLANMLAGGKPLVQRFGDFVRGRRTTKERLYRNNLVPTLKDAVPGDLSLVLPYRIMKDIEEMLVAMDKVAPGVASEETLLYGVEVKFYSNKIIVNNNFETSIKNLFAVGDGAGVSRGLMQASANGLQVSKYLLNKK